MSPAKKTMIDIIVRQPDDSTYDEILKELAFSRMIDRGIQDVAAARLHSPPQVAEAVKSWQT